MRVTYDQLTEKIEETRKYQYDCTILAVFAGEIMIQDEEFELSNDYSTLLLYFDTVACDDKTNFKVVIDYLYDIIKSGRKIDNFDSNYILNKTEIVKIFDKYKQGFISKELLLDKLKRHFYTDNISHILEILFNRWNISISV